MLVFLSVSNYLSYDGSVGSASAYQSVDSGFGSRLSLIFLTRRKIARCLTGVLFITTQNFVASSLLEKKTND